MDCGEACPSSSDRPTQANFLLTNRSCGLRTVWPVLVPYEYACLSTYVTRHARYDAGTESKKRGKAKLLSLGAFSNSTNVKVNVRSEMAI